jgi:hypothetical protein
LLTLTYLQVIVDDDQLAIISLTLLTLTYLQVIVNDDQFAIRIVDTRRFSCSPFIPIRSPILDSPPLNTIDTFLHVFHELLHRYFQVIVGTYDEQFICTVLFVNSLVKMPEPGEVSEQMPMASP